MRHLTVETLIEQIENKADVTALAEANQHLSECERCQNNAGEFSELLVFLNNDAMNEPPAELLEWGIQLFQPVLRPIESKTSKVLRVAKLVFDSFEQPAPTGVRYVGSVPRQLLFRAGTKSMSMSASSRERNGCLWPARSCQNRSVSLKTHP